MATFYVDYENGNDNHAGTSFNLLASGADGRINSPTFSSTGANFPNDGSLINQYLSIFNGSSYSTYRVSAWVSSTSLTLAQIPNGNSLINQTVDRQYYIGGRLKTISGASSTRIEPGDEIRIKASPEPTSLGQSGVWTSGGLDSAKNPSSTVGTGGLVTVTFSSAHGYSTGDTIVFSSLTGINGTWEITVVNSTSFTLDNSTGVIINNSGGGIVRRRNTARILLQTPVTENIASTGNIRNNWTGVGTVTTTTSQSSTVVREGKAADQITIPSAFTTGKAAYYTLPATLDLSAYEQVSFWLNSSAALSAGQCELRLCSDTAGDTVVNTISIPAAPNGGRTQVFTVNNNGPLGNSIKSITLFINSDISTVSNHTIYFSNIIACKAPSAPDSLTLNSLIGKNTAGETWWPIQSINGTRVMLDNTIGIGPMSSSYRGYYGTTETVTTYKREAFLTPIAVVSNSVYNIVGGSSDLARMTYSGGWNRTDMSTQTSQSWFDGQGGTGYFFYDGSNTQYVNIDNIHVTRYGNFVGVFSSSTRFWNFTNITATSCTDAFLLGGGTNYNIENFYGHGNSSGIYFSGNSVAFCDIKSCFLNSNTSSGLNLVGFKNRCQFKAYNNTNAATIITGDSNILYNCEFGLTGGTNSNSISGSTPSVGITYLKNCLSSDSGMAGSGYFAQRIVSIDNNQVKDDTRIFEGGGLISSATDQRYTNSGYSWKFQPTDVARNAFIPLRLSISKIAVAANTLVTVKAWMRRSNAGLTMSLVCKGGQLTGVPNDVSSSMTAAANTWQQVSIQFTPTETGVIEIEAQAYGGTTYSGWVDDLEVIRG